MLKRMNIILVLLFVLTLPLTSEANSWSHLSANPPKIFLEAAEEDLAAKSSYDPRKTPGILPSVKNQGNNGTCWTFASMAAMETNYLKYKSSFDIDLGTDPNLSEMYLAWFAFNNPDPEKAFTFMDTSVMPAVASPDALPLYILASGGNVEQVMAIMSRLDGPVLDSVMPYNREYQLPWCEDDKPIPHPTPENPIKYIVKGDELVYSDDVLLLPSRSVSPSDKTIYAPVLRMVETLVAGSFTSSDSEARKTEVRNTMKRMLIRTGGVDIGFSIRSGGWNQNGRQPTNKSTFGYFTPKGSTEKTFGHAVLVVGWDDNFSRENFRGTGTFESADRVPEHDGAWLVLNSWGSEWGDGGFFWMSYDELIDDLMAFVVEDADEHIRHYGHDYLGKTTNFKIENQKGNTAYMAAIFTVQGDYEKLKEIGLYLTDSKQDYELYVYDLGKVDTVTSPVSGTLAASVIREGVEQAGYYTQVLDKSVPLTRGNKFSIVLKMTNASYGYPLAIESQADQTDWQSAVIESGDSFFSSDGQTWIDGTTISFPEHYEYFSRDVTHNGADACLKGFTFIPDERNAEDWSITMDSDKADLSIKLLRETAPGNVVVTGKGIEGITAAIKPDAGSVGSGVSGAFYELNVSCTVTDSANAAITEIRVDGESLMMPGNGVSLSEMTKTEKQNDDSKPDDTPDPDDKNESNNVLSGPSGGCDAGFAGAGVLLVLALLMKKR